MPFIGTVTGSFTAGRRASAFSRDWSPSDLGNDLRMWLNPSDTSTTTFQSGPNNLTSITDASGNSGATININNTPQQGTEDNKEIIVFDHASNEYLSTGSFAIAANGNHWAAFAGTIASPDNSKDSIWSFDTTQSPARDYAISSGNASQFDGELDLDGLSSNRISSTAGNSINWDNGLTQDYWYVISVIFNKTGNQIRCRVSGTDIFTPVNDYDNSLTPNLDVRIFRNRSNERMSGIMAEFFTVADVPGTGGTDISTVEKAEGYLAHKWNGAPGNVNESILDRFDVSHPYKSVAPTG